MQQSFALEKSNCPGALDHQAKVFRRILIHQTNLASKEAAHAGEGHLHHLYRGRWALVTSFC